MTRSRYFERSELQRCNLFGRDGYRSSGQEPLRYRQDAVVTGKRTATSISEEREKAAESETETASESESTDGGAKSDGNAEKGQFEVESESKSAAGNEASDTADDAEEVKHTLTFVIYE